MFRLKCTLGSEPGEVNKVQRYQLKEEGANKGTKIVREPRRVYDTKEKYTRFNKDSL